MPSAVTFPDLDAGAYNRGGKPVAYSKLKDKKLKSKLRRNEREIEQAEREAAATELLERADPGSLEAEGIERTYKFKQSEIRKHLDLASAQKSFDLSLEFGPYSCDFTRNGRYLLLGGGKGHLATLDWKSGRLISEIHVRERVRDVCFLQNDSMYAAAQRKFVYIYEGKTGAEIHCLKHHTEANALQFLPFHFLLASVGDTGWLKYQDVSTGQLVSEHRSKLGPCFVLAQNRWNGVLMTGHGNGVVNLWTPQLRDPAARVLTHKAPVTAVSVDREGRYMATAGRDGQLKIWDLRSSYKELHSYFCPTPAKKLDISDRGMLAVGWGTHVSVWKDALATKQQSPYLTHNTGGSAATSLQFAAFEDVLGLGHERGYSSLIVPGAGEANYDALELNPFESSADKREREVRSLLEKLPPNTIALDPSFVGDMDRTAPEIRQKEALDEARDRKVKEDAEYVPRERQRGRNSALRKVLRKKNRYVIDERRLKVERLLAQEKQLKADRVARERGENPESKADVGVALSRFSVLKKDRRL
ncbi:WD repeat-containing protein 46 [Savitreella phatthalungensis]